MDTFEIVTLALPPFVKLTGKMLLLPIFTLEKFKLAWLALSSNVEVVTVNVAVALVTLPTPLETVTLNCDPLSADVVEGVVYEAELAPPIATPLLFHWYVSVPVPVAVTENVAVRPESTDLLAGCDVIDGGALTVRVAALLVTLPEALVTVTVNEAPLSDATVAGVVKLEDVAPPIAEPFSEPLMRRICFRFRRHSGHGRTCRCVASVANDPAMRTCRAVQTFN